jgi:glycerol-3-phosphate dehydrogenase (NAD+)
VSRQGFTLPRNVRATTDAAEAIAGAQYAVHAVPVQHSRSFLSGVREVLPKDVPIICVSKGLEVGSGCMMSEVIPSALGRRQPAVFLSGPSFAKEVSQQPRRGGGHARAQLLSCCWLTTC